MRIRPGKHALWLAGAALPLVLFSGLYSFVLWVLLLQGVILLVLAGMDYFFLRRSFQAIQIKRTLPGYAGRGATFSVQIQVINPTVHTISGSMRDLPAAGVLPKLWQCTFVVASEELWQTNYLCSIAERGLYQWGLTHLRLHGRFGVLEGQRALGEEQSVKIYPESVVPDGEYKVFTQIAYNLKKSSSVLKRGEGMDFETIDHFSEGDDPRHIDWPATARSGEFMVRRYQQEQHRNVMILLDCGRLMAAQTVTGTKLDRAVDAALLLMRVAEMRGDRCSFGIYDNRVHSFFLSQNGTPLYKQVLENIYDVQCSFMESDFSTMFSKIQQVQRKRSLVIILSDVVDSDTSGRMRQALVELKRQHIVVFVALKTPAIHDFIDHPAESARGVVCQAVATRLAYEREKTLHQMMASGVIVLDCEPEKVHVSLINHYVRIREQGLL